MASGEFDIKVDHAEKNLLFRIMQRLRRFQPGDPMLLKTMTDISQVLEAQAKINITSQRLIDSGRLRASVRGHVERSGNTVSAVLGSHGVPYAAYHEYGFQGVISKKSPYQMRLDHFWAFKLPKAIDVTVPPHDRTVKYDGRPYIRPAIEKHRASIIAALRELARFRGV